MNFSKKYSFAESAAASDPYSFHTCVAMDATTLNISSIHDSDTDDVHSVMSDITDVVETADEEPYDPNALSVQQRCSGTELFAKFVCDCRWAILFAQMQSGKTETYLFVACEMLRQNFVKSVVIFSGNAETELKAQLTNVDKRNRFYRKYRNYLRRYVHTLNEDTIDDALALVGAAASIQVYWGTELKKYRGPTQNTLFIWDESHFAQSIHQCPDKFLRDVGISADGDEETLRRQGNYVLSISATPFSEYSDNHHLDQGKEMVRMAPGVGYNSVAIMKETGRIIPFETVEDGLAQACAIPHNTPKWGIVRITTKNEDLVRATVAAHGYSVVIFDSFVDCVIDGQVKTDLSFLKQAPTRDTIVLLRGKCRMGKELDKEHILFCFETAKTSATDTVLQGLLGRCCGYFHSTTIVVFLHKNIVDSDELQRYIDMTNGHFIIPTKGRNIDQCKHLRSIIPIKVSRSRITVARKTEMKTHLQLDIISAFNDGNITNLNSATDLEKIRNMVDNNPDTRFVVRFLETTKKTYANVPAEIQASINDRAPIKLSPGCWSAENEVTLWVIGANGGGLTEGDVYVDCRLNDNADIPQTTKREVFAHKRENGTTGIANGSFSVSLRPETAFSVEEMRSDLLEIIELSLNTRLSNSRSVNSNQDFVTKEYKGICVTENVLKSLMKGGSIFAEVKAKYASTGLTLRVTKASGVVPQVLKQAGLVRLTAITW